MKRQAIKALIGGIIFAIIAAVIMYMMQRNTGALQIGAAKAPIDRAIIGLMQGEGGCTTLYQCQCTRGCYTRSWSGPAGNKTAQINFYRFKEFTCGCDEKLLYDHCWKRINLRHPRPL